MIFRHRARQATAPEVLEGRRVYAIGDIHGCLDLAQRLLAWIERDNAERDPADVHIIFLGDLIDRGPKSAQVIEWLSTEPAAETTRHFVMGNHEEAFLQILQGRLEQVDEWMHFGGAQTLESYGIEPGLALTDPDGFAVELAEKVPSAHREWLGRMVDKVMCGDYLFVHAGIRPGVPLKEQSPNDLRWIREPFLSDPRPHGVMVVHGHTVTDQVERRPNRIGIDTGAHKSGRLTALGLQGSERWLLSTRPEGRDGANDD